MPMAKNSRTAKTAGTRTAKKPVKTGRAASSKTKPTALGNSETRDIQPTTFPTRRRINTDAGYLRVRRTPALEPGNILGVLRNGADVEVLGVEGAWARILLSAGGAPIQAEDATVPVVCYMSAQYLDLSQVGGATLSPVTSGPPVVTVPPVQPADHGVHAPQVGGNQLPRLGLHTLGNGGLAREEADNGCKFFCMMDSFSDASQLVAKHPDAIVMARRYVGTKIPSTDDMIGQLEGASNRALVYIGLNEADPAGAESSNIPARAGFDKALATRIKQVSGATYVGGTFSMGTPDFTSNDVCLLMKEHYAPLYNNGLMAFDMHNYSPKIEHIDRDDDLIWYERRYEFLFTHCGFDPRIRAIYSSETGVDEGGVGGIPAHNYTSAQFEHWCNRWIEIHSRPIIVNGVSYPSPYVGGAIFQYGSYSGWWGYDVKNYMNVLRKFY